MISALMNGLTTRFSKRVKGTPGVETTRELNGRQLGEIVAAEKIESSYRKVNPREYTISDAEAQLLEKLVKESGTHAGPIVEIGTLLGMTTTRMALWKLPHQKILSVDNFCWNGWGLTSDEHYELTSEFLFYLRNTGHVELIRTDKEAFYQAYSGPPPSLVFLDAWHTYEQTKRDIEWAQSVGTRIICGHDYSTEFWPEVVRAVEETGGAEELADTLFVMPRQKQ